MKRTMIILAVILVMPFGLARAGILKKIAGVLGATVGAAAPQVSSPLLEQMGVSLYGVNMVVTNGTPYFAEVFVYGKQVAILGPGDLAYDDRHFEPLNPQIPIMVRIYREYRDGRLEDFLGAAGHSFWIYGSYPVSQSWVITKGEIQTPGSGYVLLEEEFSSPTMIRAETKKVKFPRQWWNASADIQIINNTPFPAIMRINGRNWGNLTPGEFRAFYARNFGISYSQTLTITLVFVDGGQFLGVWERQFYVPSDGLAINQFIVGPYDIPVQR